MLDASLSQHLAQKLTGLDGNRTDKNRLSLCVRLLDGVADRTKFLFLRLIYGVVQILPDHRHIRWNLHNVHSVNITEFLFLCKCGTSHTALLCVFIKEVLEGDSSKCLTLPVDLHMLLCLDRLMQTVRITSTWHDTSGELIDNKNLVILYHIILVTEHQIVCPQSKNNIVLNLQILRIRQVLNVEEILHFLDSVLCQVDRFFLLIDNEIAGLFDFLTQNSVHLGKLAACLASLHLSCQNIACFIELRGLAALSGNNQRSPRLVNQNGVDLIDNGIFEPSLYELLFIDDHVVP